MMRVPSGAYLFSDPTKIYVSSRVSGDRYEEIVAHENFHRFHTQNTRLGILLIVVLDILGAVGHSLSESNQAELIHFAERLTRNMFLLQEGGAITSAFTTRWLYAPVGEAEDIVDPYFESLDPIYTSIGVRHVTLEMDLLSLTEDGNVSPLLLESFNHALTRFLLEAASLAEVKCWNFLDNPELRAFLTSDCCSADHRLMVISDAFLNAPQLLVRFREALRISLQREFGVKSFDSVHSLDAALVAYARKQLESERYIVDALEFETLVISLCFQALELCFPGFADLKIDPDEDLRERLGWIRHLESEVKRVLPAYYFGTLQVAETLEEKANFHRSDIVRF
jgi:hypothetical protein